MSTIPYQQGVEKKQRENKRERSQATRLEGLGIGRPVGLRESGSVDHNREKAGRGGVVSLYSGVASLGPTTASRRGNQGGSSSKIASQKGGESSNRWDFRS